MDVTIVSLVFLVIGFLMGGLAGAGLSWLYVVSTFFSRLKKWLEEIKPIDQEEREGSQRERFRRHIKEG